MDIEDVEPVTAPNTTALWSSFELLTGTDVVVNCGLSEANSAAD